MSKSGSILQRIKAMNLLQTSHDLRDEASFQPGISRIVDQPPARVVWVLPLILMILVSAAILWASLSKIEIISPTKGVLLPSGRVKLIQTTDIAVVRKILVAEGDRVTAGQPLIVFDNTMDNADAGRIREDLLRAKLKRARLKAMATAKGRKLGTFEVPSETPKDERSEQLTLLRQQWRKHLSDLATLFQKVVTLKAAANSIRAQIRAAEAVLPYAKTKLGRVEKLAKNGHAAAAEVDDARQTFTNQQQSIFVLQQELQEAKTNVKLAEQERNASNVEFQENTLLDLENTEQQIGEMGQEIRKLDYKVSKQTLTAPINGVVQDLKAHTVGGVVQAAEPLMKIVPENADIEVEAKVLNRDIGFVHVGQDVQVKIDAFNYTKYGGVNGRIVKIARDSDIDQTLGPVYRAIIELERDYMTVEGNKVKLIPGMTATVDIHTGERRVIEYILTPLLRYKSEAFRER